MNPNGNTNHPDKNPRLSCGRTQPSIRDYLLCLNKDRSAEPLKMTNNSQVTDEVGNKKDPAKDHKKKHIDIGLTVEDLLALPNTPPVSNPNCQQSSTISSSNHQSGHTKPPSHFNTEVAHLLAYVRGRPSESIADDHDLTDFEKWLSEASNGDQSGDEDKEADEQSFDWPTDDRVLMMCRKNGRNGPAGSSGSRAERDAENRRIDGLLNMKF